MRIKPKLAALAAIIGLAVSLVPAQALAATGVIYISPSSTSVQKAKSFTVALRINPGTAVDSVQATVGYSTTKLQFVSLSVGTFSTCIQDSGGGGAVTFSCAKLGGSTSSDSLIGNITFKALAGSGSTTLSVSNANAAHNGSYTNPSTSGGTVKFTSPPSPPPAPVTKPLSSSSTSKSSTTTSSSTSSKTTAGPASPASGTSKKTTSSSSSSSAAVVLANPVVAGVQFTSASIQTSANVPVRVLIQYGTDKSSLSTATPLGSLNKTASISLGSPQLTPGTAYFYQVIAKNSSGKTVAQSPIESFTTKGFTIKVTVLDSHYHPLVGKVIMLHSVQARATTNSLGVATFAGVSPGLHHAEYVVGSHTYSQSVYVANEITAQGSTQTAAPQTAAVILAGYVQSGSTFPARIAVFLFLILVAAIVFETRKSLGRHLSAIVRHPTIPKPPMPTNIIT